MARARRGQVLSESRSSASDSAAVHTNADRLPEIPIRAILGPGIG